MLYDSRATIRVLFASRCRYHAYHTYVTRESGHLRKVLSSETSGLFQQWAPTTEKKRRERVCALANVRAKSGWRRLPARYELIKCFFASCVPIMPRRRQVRCFFETCLFRQVSVADFSIVSLSSTRFAWASRSFLRCVISPLAFRAFSSSISAHVGKIYRLRVEGDDRRSFHRDRFTVCISSRYVDIIHFVHLTLSVRIFSCKLAKRLLVFVICISKYSSVFVAIWNPTPASRNVRYLIRPASTAIEARVFRSVEFAGARIEIPLHAVSKRCNVRGELLLDDKLTPELPKWSKWPICNFPCTLDTVRMWNSVFLEI